MKDNELRNYLGRIAHAVECIADSLSPKEAEISPEKVKVEEVVIEEKKEPEIAPVEKIEEVNEVTAEDVKVAEESFDKAVDELPHEEEKPVEQVKVKEKPIVKNSPFKPRKEVKRINPYRKPEDGPIKPVSGFRIKED